jgi:hypothetical protein
MRKGGAARKREAEKRERESVSKGVRKGGWGARGRRARGKNGSE